MIKLFRKTRQNMLMENKTGKYFKYAIGEIILVVIGILIALSINNWNTIRLQQKDSLELSKRLHEENIANIKELKIGMETLKKTKAANINLLNLMGKDYINKSHHTLDSLIYIVIAYPDFNVKASVLTEAISTGKISIFKSSQLKSKLYSIPPLLQLVQTRETNIEEDLADNFFPFMYKNYSMRKMDFNFSSSKNKLGPSVFDTFDGRRILNNFEFENLLDNLYFVRNGLTLHYEELLKGFEEFSVLLEKEINE